MEEIRNDQGIHDEEAHILSIEKPTNKKWVSFVLMDFFELSFSKQEKFVEILRGRARNSFHLAYFIFMKESMSDDTMKEIIRVAKEFKEFSPQMRISDVKLYVEKLVIDTQLSHSTILKKTKLLKIYLGTLYELNSHEQAYLRFSEKKILDLKGLRVSKIRVVVETFELLFHQKRYEEFLYLYLTYALGLAPSFLKFLEFGRISAGNILSFWNPYKQILQKMALDLRTLAMLESYQAYSKMGTMTDKTVNEHEEPTDTSSKNSLMFRKPPSVWNRLFKNGF